MNYEIVAGDLVTVSSLNDVPIQGTLVSMNSTSFTILDVNGTEVHVIVDQLVMSKDIDNE